MSVDVARAIAQSLSVEMSSRPIDIVWHGGEPTVAGIDLLERLVSEFDSVGLANFRHGIQTNATLINDDWIDFLKRHNFLVGVSVDGPSHLNRRRINWGGREAYEMATRGIDLLRKNEIPYTAIAVVGDEALDCAAEFYQYFQELGCIELGINIEESEGVNVAAELDTHRVSKFWDDLWTAWGSNPTLRIREIDQVLGWMTVEAGRRTQPTVTRDPFPTVGWNGDVVLFSPEFLGVQSLQYDDFLIGNVLDRGLPELVVEGLKRTYATDFQTGIAACESVCDYFSYCLGGQASNKFFELGSTNGTETVFCIEQAKQLVDAGVRYLEREGQERELT